MRSLLIACLVVVAVGATRAGADPVVLGVSGDHAYVDLGARDGVGAGSELELVREIVVTDPVTKKTLRDAFALGTVVVERAGEHVCEVAIGPDLKGRVAVGDRIALAGAARRFADPWAEQVLASKAPAGGGDVAVVVGGDVHASASASVAAAEAAREVWLTTLGKPPRDRAAAWRTFLAANPGTPYAATIRAEIASLEGQATVLDAAVAAANAPDQGAPQRPALADALAELAGRPIGSLYAAVPARVSPGRPIGVVFTKTAPLTDPVWLYVQAPGTRSFARVALASDGDAYLRATIPAELVRPGAVAWYVAAADQPLIGDEDEPRTITVEHDLAEGAPERGRTQIHTSLDYVDFDGGLEDGFDQYAQAELDFAYQFRAQVHTARVGFGTM